MLLGIILGIALMILLILISFVLINVMTQNIDIMMVLEEDLCKRVAALEEVHKEENE